MYENGNKRRIRIDLPSFNMPNFKNNKKETNNSAIISVLFKFSLICVFFFIFVFCISKFGTTIKKEYTESDFNPNITYIEKQVTKYFNKNNIPQKKEDSTSMSIYELIDQKVLEKKEIKDYNKCDVKNSYVSLTKKRDNLYKLNIHLKCDGIVQEKESTIKNI